MRAWSKILRGVGLIAEGAAEALERAPERAPAGTPEEPAGSGMDAGTVTDYLRTLVPALAAAAQRTAHTPDAEPADDAAETADGADEAPDEEAVNRLIGDVIGAAADDTVIPAVENGVPLLECPEMLRQRSEARRRRVLRADPVNAIAVMAYWTRHLVESPTRAEEWVRCLECVPGSAPDRFSRALHAGVSDLRRYAGYFDEIQNDLAEARRVADAMRASTPDLAGDLLDEDRLGRILYCIGDRPDVEALTGLADADGTVAELGPDHIAGPAGTQGTPEAPVEPPVADLATR